MEMDYLPLSEALVDADATITQLSDLRLISFAEEADWGRRPLSRPAVHRREP